MSHSILVVQRTKRGSVDKFQILNNPPEDLTSIEYEKDNSVEVYHGSNCTHGKKCGAANIVALGVGAE